MTPPLPSHVLMTADGVGGVWTYALDLGGGLIGAGIDVTLAVMGPSPTPAQRKAAAGVPGLRVIDTGLPLDWLAASSDEVAAAAREVARLAREARADLVHLNAPALAAGGAFDVPVVGACHSCLATWWAAVKRGPMPEDFRWRTELLAAGYDACTGLIAPTRAFAQQTARLYPRARPRAVHNGRAGVARAVAGERPAGVLTAGRLWDEGKNLAGLDQAAARLAAPVAAAGPLRGPQGQGVDLRHVEPLGPLTGEALADRLARTPLFASLALYEPFGLAVLEAAQAGCALALSDIASFRELWDGAALFVDPADPNAAADAINALLADRPRTARLAAAARERAGRYTVAAMVEQTLAVYAAALAPREEAAA